MQFLIVDLQDWVTETLRNRTCCPSYESRGYFAVTGNSNTTQRYSSTTTYVSDKIFHSSSFWFGISSLFWKDMHLNWGELSRLKSRMVELRFDRGPIGSHAAPLHTWTYFAQFWLALLLRSGGRYFCKGNDTWGTKGERKTNSYSFCS